MAEVRVRLLNAHQVQAIYEQFIDSLPYDSRYSHSLQDPVFYRWFRSEFGTDFHITEVPGSEKTRWNYWVVLDDLSMVEFLMKI